MAKNHSPFSQIHSGWELRRANVYSLNELMRHSKSEFAYSPCICLSLSHWLEDGHLVKSLHCGQTLRWTTFEFLSKMIYWHSSSCESNGWRNFRPWRPKKALSWGIIERAMLVVTALFPHMKRGHLLRAAISKNLLINCDFVCKAALTAQEKITFVNF